MKISYINEDVFGSYKNKSVAQDKNKFKNKLLKDTKKILEDDFKKRIFDRVYQHVMMGNDGEIRQDWPLWDVNLEQCLDLKGIGYSIDNIQIERKSFHAKGEAPDYCNYIMIDIPVRVRKTASSYEVHTVAWTHIRTIGEWLGLANNDFNNDEYLKECANDYFEVDKGNNWCFITRFLMIDDSSNLFSVFISDEKDVFKDFYDQVLRWFREFKITANDVYIEIDSKKISERYCKSKKRFSKYFKASNDVRTVDILDDKVVDDDLRTMEKKGLIFDMCKSFLADPSKANNKSL